MGSDDHDWSFYKTGTSRPPRRHASTKKRGNVYQTRQSVDVQPVAVGDLKSKIKELLIFNPDLTVDEIIEGLNTDTIVSKVAVSAVKTEFRHSLKVVRDAGLLK